MDNALFLNRFERLMREEFGQVAELPCDPFKKDSQPEHVNLRDSETNLHDLENLMREELFPSSLFKQSPKKLSFVYQGLKSGHVRLLHLSPGKSTEPLTGRLVQVSLASKPEYEALSYTWGSPNMYHEFHTKEGAIPITTSLKLALTRLRLLSKSRVLWIDAICINQQDNEEKSEQILLMPKIYSSAFKTVVYLGPEADRSDLAIGLIEKVGKKNFNTLKAKIIETSSLTSFGLPGRKSGSWIAFRAFWRRSWFKRIWIIQEFLLSREVSIICGDWERNWRVFLEAAIKINDLGLTLRGGYSSESSEQSFDINEFYEANAGAMSMLKLCHMRSSANQMEHLQYQMKDIHELDEGMLREADNLFPELPGLNLSGLMGWFRQFPETSQVFEDIWDRETLETNCRMFGLPLPPVRETMWQGGPFWTMMDLTESCEATDPRDRLFALLSLANDLTDKEREILRPDYSKSLKWVVCRYAAVLVRKGHAMDILYKVSRPTSPSYPESQIHILDSPEEEIPSWIGNLTTPILPTSKGVTLGAGGKDIYHATGTSEPRVRISGLQNDHLIVAGGLIDTIDRVGIGPILDRSVGLEPLAILGTLIDADGIFNSISEYSTGESMEEVKWRTLIANRISTNDSLAPPDYAKQYTSWRKHVNGLALASFAGAKPRQGMDPGMALFEPENEGYFNAVSAGLYYKVCRTSGGYVGLVPLDAEVGDRVALVLGGRVPFVLREWGEGRVRGRELEKWKLVGGCYIHGMMDGQGLTLPDWKEQEICLR
ncbi:hypothetical protein NHQ30_010885 [Ciborinia camelliae]|nr:hypothetical protein NHQ30_010885 [Ciborinia camelliae]